MSRRPAAPPPADDAASPWRADAVRHQLLLRALPGQRHEVLGPLSVLRMALALLQRRPPADAAALQARLAELAQQVQDGVAAVAEMRCWDAGRTAPQPLPQVMATVCTLLRTAASLRGHQLLGPDLPPGRPGSEPGAEPATDLTAVPVPDAPVPDAPVPDAHYALLGLLVHVLDTATQPLQLRLSLDGAVVVLHTEVLDGGVSPATARPGPAPGPEGLRSVDRVALGWLLDDLGWALLEADAGGKADRPGHRQWRLALPPGSARPAA